MFVIKQNDTLPKLECQLFDCENEPINLDLCGVKFHMVNRKNEVVINRDVEIISSEGGTVKYNWLEGDTSQSGTFKGEFEVNMPNGDVISVPNDGYFTISIVQELD